MEICFPISNCPPLGRSTMNHLVKTMYVYFEIRMKVKISRRFIVLATTVSGWLSG